MSIMKTEGMKNMKGTEYPKDHTRSKAASREGNSSINCHGDRDRYRTHVILKSEMPLYLIGSSYRFQVMIGPTVYYGNCLATFKMAGGGVFGL